VPVPTPSALLSAWTVQPLAIVAALLLALWYARATRRSGTRLPRGAAIQFGIGLAMLVFATCGFAGAYLDDLFWVWTAQQLALLLVVPYLILAGRPLQLAGPAVHRFLHTGFVRFFANPLIGPALVPLLSVALFFGPLPRWAIDVPPLGWAEQLVLVAIGALIVLPLVGTDQPRTSLAVGLALAIGSFELVLDAVPGVALRLHRTLSTSYFDARVAHPWSPAPLHDQQLAGGVLWCVAELLDLPFLIIVFYQWLKADERDAADIDAVLEAERAARGEPDVDETRDVPWWISDPAMQRRLQRPD
jgi:cytochrome c oxidase assembly factor CtaG